MTDHLTAYLNYIKKIKIDEDIFELARKYRNSGCEKSKQKMAESCLSFVVSIARKYTYQDSEAFLELVHAGNYGLAEAIEKYDPERGVKLITYAKSYIHMRILEHIRNFYRETGCPQIKRHIRLFYNIRKYTDANQRLSSEKIKIIKESYKVSDEDIELMYNFIFAKSKYIDSEKPENNSEVSAVSLTSKENSPEENYIAKELATVRKNALRTSLKNLSNRQQDIANRRWFTDSPDTLTTIGDDYSVSAEAIRMDEKRAMDRLKNTIGQSEELSA
jgi:RNA polymerase sigma-32 factor